MNRHLVPRKVKGFTLIEVVISVSVMMLMLSVVIAEYPTAVMRATLNNVGYSLSLLVRESQLRGSSISSGNQSLNDESPYGGSGIYLSSTSSSSAILFNDTVYPLVPKPYGVSVGNGLYENNGSINETYTTLTFPSGYSISKLCVGTGYPFSCGDDLSPSISNITISFIRPKAEPNIYVNNSQVTNYSAGCIEFSSPKGQKKSVSVYGSGMIRTLSTPCK